MSKAKHLMFIFKSVLLTVVSILVIGHSGHLLPKSQSLGSSLMPLFPSYVYEQILLILPSEYIQCLTNFLSLHCPHRGPGYYHSSPGLLHLPPNWSPYFLPCFSSVSSLHSSWYKPVRNVSWIMSLMGKRCSGFPSRSQ